MSSVERFATAKAQALLDSIIHLHPTITLPSKQESELNVRTSILPPVDWLGRYFNDLLNEEIAFENDLTTSGYEVCGGYPYRLVLKTGFHGEVVGVYGVIVPKHDGSTLTVDPESPMERSLIAANGERSLTDRIRVASFLVRVLCDPVGFSGDPVRLIRPFVGQLGQLVSLARLDYSTNPDAETGDDSDPSCE